MNNLSARSRLILLALLAAPPALALIVLPVSVSLNLRWQKFDRAGQADWLTWIDDWLPCLVEKG